MRWFGEYDVEDEEFLYRLMSCQLVMLVDYAPGKRGLVCCSLPRAHQQKEHMGTFENRLYVFTTEDGFSKEDYNDRIIEVDLKGPLK